MNLRFSLVLATVGRTWELEEFFRSLELQAYSQYELILVDQNEPDFLKEIVTVWSQRLNIVYLHSERGLSKARNLGLSHASGSVLAFPDDDCWYSTGLLNGVDRFFAERTEYDVLSVGVTDTHGVLSGNRWIQSQCDIKPLNIFRTSVTYAMFLRRNHLTATVQFDEKIGPGTNTQFGCGEDTDYLLSVLKEGIRGYFTRSLLVHHPRRDMLSSSIPTSRALDYGAGMGYVCRKHSLCHLALFFAIYDLFRATIALCMLRLRSARLCFVHGNGVLKGVWS